MAKILLSFFIFFLFFSSCKVIDPEETIPSFIKVDKVSFKANPGQGTDSVIITDVWVFVDDQAIGAYELPAIIPILQSGEHKVMLRFGVILNGIAATRSINPFFTSYTRQINLVEDSVIEMNPDVSYMSSCNFFWNENGQEGFEDGGITIDSIFGSNSKILKTDTNVYEGSYSGQIHLTKDLPYFIAASTNEYTISSSGSKSCLMEFHCKNVEAPLGVGIYVTYANSLVVKVDYLTIKPGPGWRKIYMNMSNLLDSYLAASKYKVFFSSNIPSGNQTADIYIDNIKLISF